MPSTVTIDNVTKYYGDFCAIPELSFEINEGEFFTLLGPSGCGKTTLLRMIAGFNTIEGGIIRFGDKVINNLSADKRDIGMVFQNYAIFPHLTVKENVAYGLKARKVKGEELERRTQEAMKLMHIEEHAAKYPQQMNGGQQQRIALARAIVIEPGVLLMDEPLSNLDAKLRVEMRSAIRAIQQKLGITTIYVTHDQEEALSISDRIAIMNKGHVEQLGTPYDIYARPANTFVADFIGISSFLQVDIKAQKVCLAGKHTLGISLKKQFAGPAILSVRPEGVVISEAQEDAYQGTVESALFLGDSVCYTLRTEDQQQLTANQYLINDNKIHKVGDKVSISFVEQRLNLFTGEGKEALY